MRGIRQVASVPIPSFGAAELAVGPNDVGEAAAKVKRIDYFIPVSNKHAEMLQGAPEEMAEQLMEMIRAKGGLQ